MTVRTMQDGALPPKKVFMTHIDVNYYIPLLFFWILSLIARISHIPVASRADPKPIYA